MTDAKAAIEERAEVLSVETGSGHAVRALLHAPGIAAVARPMQFVMVKVREGLEPFLRRPFSLSHIMRDEGIIGVTWDVVGRGTEIMSRWEPGGKVPVLGPLGNGFAVPPAGGERRRLYMIAGGTGLAPMLPLAQEGLRQGWEVVLFYGACSAEFLLDFEPFKRLGCRTEVITDDGSFGRAMFVTAAAREEMLGASPEDLTVACGPAPMTRAAKALCEGSRAPLYVSLEERMACGTGLCKGCAVKMASSEAYFHVCTDGPVFLAEDVELESPANLGGAKK